MTTYLQRNVEVPNLGNAPDNDGHRSHRQSKKSERRPKPKESSGKQGGASQAAPFSFLFVVWQSFTTKYQRKLWGRDPRHCLALREWDRNIAYEYQSSDEYGQQTFDYNMGVHSTHSIFNCWRFLPCIYADADTSIIEDLEAEHRWMQLEFDHDSREPGMTRISGSERHVAGRSPSWIPGLLPETYAPPQSSNSPQSKGLGGPLGIIIGLMALNRRPRHADHVFQQGWWRNNRWAGEPRSARAVPVPEPDSKGPPRGVLVQICYDEYSNPHGSNFETLNDFEENGKAIIG
ncbi:hypothetical protein CcaCcLH18_02389 [Colletotrichum camelliae]|nr:hypothetical protein CcaCcLH18_02389 [Colletotrichum camelliae]